MASKPVTIALLDTNETNRVAPAGSKTTDGYVLSDIFPSGNANYLMGWHGDFTEWLNERIHDSPADTTTNISDRVGGAGTGLFVGAAAIHLEHNTLIGDTAVVPQGTLHVFQSAHAQTPDVGADAFVLEGTTNIGMTFLGDGVTAINFGDTGDANVGAITYTHATNLITLRASASGVVGIKNTGMRIGGSLGSFPATLTVTAIADGPTKVRLDRTGVTRVATDVVGVIEFNHADTNDAGIGATVAGIIEGTVGETALVFSTGVPSALVENMRLTAAGVLGVGATAPDLGVGIHIKSGDSGLASLDSNADDFFIENTAGSDTGITIASTTNCRILFADAADNNIGGISYLHPTDSMILRTNNADSVVISSSGVLGVGAAPDLGVGIHVKKSDTTGNVNTGGDGLVIEEAANTGLTILTGSANIGSIYFADAGDNDIGGMQYDHASNALIFRANNGERVRVTSGGILGVGAGVASVDLGDLHIKVSDTGSATANYNLVIEENSNSGITILSSATASGVIEFGDSGAPNRGQISYSHLNDDMSFRTASATRATIASDGGVVVGSPTGGSQGAGTVNATGVFDDGVILTDYVFEAYETGIVDREKWPSDQAAQFATKLDMVFDLEKFGAFWKRESRLPSMLNRDSWNTTRTSVGSLAQKLWEALEIATVHIDQLHRRIRKLEGDPSGAIQQLLGRIEHLETAMARS